MKILSTQLQLEQFFDKGTILKKFRPCSDSDANRLTAISKANAPFSSILKWTIITQVLLEHVIIGAIHAYWTSSSMDGHEKWRSHTINVHANQLRPIDSLLLKRALPSLCHAGDLLNQSHTLHEHITKVHMLMFRRNARWEQIQSLEPNSVTHRG